MNRVAALIMAGGQGERLSILAEERTKPAVPFAGKYRLIDFPLSNCVNSGIGMVGVLTQYRPHSLIDHIGVGRPWDLDRENGGLHILQAYRGRRTGGWYKGTADAVYQNLAFVREKPTDHIVILAGDHVYKMRYDEMVAFHQSNGADVTVGVVEVPWEDASRYGLLDVHSDGRIVAFEEKPAHPQFRLASMGIYVFKAEALAELLQQDARERRSTHDFGRDIVPAAIGRWRVFGCSFDGYWRDVGTIAAYWEANMDFLREPPPFALDSGEEHIRTASQHRSPARVGPQAKVSESLLCEGGVIRGTVRRSVLGRGVIVEEGAVLEDSIVLDDAVVERGAVVHRSILDKQARVGEGVVVGWGNDMTPNQDEPESLCSGITLVGKRAIVPPRVRIGRNCKVLPGVQAEDFLSSSEVPSGSTVVGRVGTPGRQTVEV